MHTFRVIVRRPGPAGPTASPDLLVYGSFRASNDRPAMPAMKKTTTSMPYQNRVLRRMIAAAIRSGMMSRIAPSTLAFFISGPGWEDGAGRNAGSGDLVAFPANAGTCAGCKGIGDRRRGQDASADWPWREWHGHLAPVAWRASTGRMPVRPCHNCARQTLPSIGRCAPVDKPGAPPYRPRGLRGALPFFFDAALGACPGLFMKSPDFRALI